MPDHPTLTDRAGASDVYGVDQPRRLPGASALESSTLQPDMALAARLLGEALQVWNVDSKAAWSRALVILRNRMMPVCDRRGALAEWQFRKTVHHVHGNLETTLRMEDAARLVDLSQGHFSRAFKVTTDLTYSQFVIRARIDLAKYLLVATDAPVSEIALRGPARA